MARITAKLAEIRSRDLPIFQTWIDRISDLIDLEHVDPFQGALSIVHTGCANYVVLILNGPYTGRIAAVNLDFNEVPYFFRDLDFLSWYERWLDELLNCKHWRLFQFR